MRNTRTKIRLRTKQKGIIYIYAVVVLFPATIMSIAFLKEGSMPPLPPIALVFLGIIALGYSTEYRIAKDYRPVVKVLSIWWIPISKTRIPKNRVQSIGVSSYKLEDTETERNAYTGEYETEGLGTYSRYSSPYLRINQQKYILSGLGSGEKMKAKIQSIAKRLNIKYTAE